MPYKLHYNITGRFQHQVLFFQWQGKGPARTWRSAATASCPIPPSKKRNLPLPLLDIFTPKVPFGTMDK